MDRQGLGMSALTIGPSSEQRACPTAAAVVDAPASSQKHAARHFPDWRSVLSGKRAENALIEFLRYGITSAVALVCDFGTLVLLTEFAGFHYLVAAALGFGAGVLVAYSFSVRWVFHSRRLPSASAERALFILIGAAGLALNQAIIFGFTELVLFPYAASKLASIGIVFTFNFTLRKMFLFTGSATPGTNRQC